MLDIIASIFTKNIVIKRLKIGEYYEKLKYHPVIRFDFSREFTDLKGYILRILKIHAKNLEISIDGFSLQHSLEAVFEEYSKKGQKVCILVDEYDKPLWVDDESLCKANADLIATMFTTIKSLAEYVRFMLILGVTRNSLSGLFSGPNNLQDLTLDRQYASLLGFTLDEIESRFSKHITMLAQLNNQTNSNVVKEMTELYNGYQFSNFTPPGIYNPISVIECFRKNTIRPYWTLTEDGSYAKLRQVYNKDRSIIFQTTYIEDAIKAINHQNYNLNQLLWQAGYLTIKEFKNRTFILRETNEETKAAFRALKWDTLFGGEKTGFFSEMKIAFQEMKINEIIQVISDRMYQLNYKTKIRDQEEFEKLMMFIIEAAGFRPRNQTSAGDGIVDIIFQAMDLNNEKIGYVLELKKDMTASQALLQIKKKGYHKAVHHCHKIVCIGLALDKTHKIIGDVEYIIFDPKRNLNIRDGGLRVNLPLDSSLSLKVDITERALTSITEKEIAEGDFNDDEKEKKK